jgi:hypothetical protein
MNQRTEHITALRSDDHKRQRSQLRRTSRNSSLHTLSIGGQQTTIRQSRSRHLDRLAPPSATSTAGILASEKSIAESLKQSRKALDAVTQHTKRNDLDTSVLSSHRVNNGDIIALVSVTSQGSSASETPPSIFVVRLRHAGGLTENTSIDGVLSAKEFNTRSLQSLRTMVDASGTYIGLLQNGGKPTASVFRLNPTGDMTKVATLQAREHSRALSDGTLSLMVKTDAASAKSTVIVRGVSNAARAPNTLLMKQIENPARN